MKHWPGVAVAIFGASAVTLGAFGAHALRGTLAPDAMQVWHTAVQYQFWHTLALGLAAMLLPRGRSAKAAMIMFTLGIVLFCGSLYALALGAPRWVGAVTPIGGAAFIAGWIALGVAFLRVRE
ncbi:MAG: DUF423 domain-containing protein [Rhodanobacteraceae bacterium]